MADTIDAAQVIDGRRIGTLQLRTFVLYLLVLFADGFDVQGITYVAPYGWQAVAMRTTGLGWALGVGRVGSIVGPWVGGVMLAAGLDARHVYLVCIVPALAAAGSVALLRRRAAGVAHPAAAGLGVRST